MCSQLLSIQMRSFSTVVFYTQSIKFGVYGGFGWPGPFPASVYSRRRIEPSKRYCGWVGEDLARPRPVRGLASRGSLFVSLSALLALLAFYVIVFFFLSFLSLQRLHVLFPFLLLTLFQFPSRVSSSLLPSPLPSHLFLTLPPSHSFSTFPYLSLLFILLSLYSSSSHSLLLLSSSSFPSLPLQPLLPILPPSLFSSPVPPPPPSLPLSTVSANDVPPGV